jgi:hypothetical protein
MNSMFLVLMGWLGLGGLGLQSDAGSQVAPELLAARYAAAAAHLQPGGDFYAIRSVEGDLEASLQAIQKLSAGLGSGGDAAEAGEFIEQLVSLLRAQGAFSTQTIAGSLYPATGGVYSTRWLVTRDPAARHSNFWEGLVGDAPAAPTLLGHLPADTVWFVLSRARPDKIWAGVREGILQLKCKGDPAAMEKTLAEAERHLGVSLDAMFGAFAGETVISLQLDQARKTPLPGRQPSIEIPAPGFLAIARTKDDALFRRAVAALGKTKQPTQTEEKDGRVRVGMTNPMPPFGFRVTACQAGDLFLIASNPEAIDAALSGNAANGGLAKAPRFKAATADLPAKCNVLSFTDSRLAATVNAVLDQMPRSGRSGGMEGLMMMGMLGKRPEISCAVAGVNLKEGVLFTGTGDGQFVRQAAAGGGMNPMLLGAIAVPSFLKARSTSSQNACINNLRQLDAAKEQWAMASGNANGAQPTAAEIGEYIKGGFERRRCPQGGTYTIGVTGENPTCSHPGHQLR